MPIPCICTGTQVELVEINGRKTSGIIKDTVVVPYYGRAAVEFVADQPGSHALSLPHSAATWTMAFKALFRYSRV